MDFCLPQSSGRRRDRGAGLENGVTSPEQVGAQTRVATKFIQDMMDLNRMVTDTDPSATIEMTHDSIRVVGNAETATVVKEWQDSLALQDVANV